MPRKAQHPLNIKQKRVEGIRFNYSFTSHKKSNHYSITVWDKLHQRIAVSILFYKGHIRIFRLAKGKYNPLCAKLIKAFKKRKKGEEWLLKLNTTKICGHL